MHSSKKNRHKCPAPTRRESTHTLFIYNKVHPVIICLCSPAKPLGEINQTAAYTPSQHHFRPPGSRIRLDSARRWGGRFVYWVHFKGESQPAGGLVPWPNCNRQAKLDCPSWSKKTTIPQSTVGCLVGRRIGHGTEKAALFEVTIFRK